MKVSALYRYPVKSCAGESLKEAVVEKRGIEYDREWMIVDKNSRFISQRETPRLALIVPKMKDTHLTLTSLKMTPLQIPLNHEDSTQEVVVWNDKCHAIDQGDDAASWMSEYLKFNCRLVRMAPGFTRNINTSTNAQIAFADDFPFHLISEASLNDLNSRLSNPLPMNRFRPNIVIGGSLPYAEDSWEEIEIAGIRFKTTKACIRCAITTIDQTTAEKGKEPLATLAKYRRGKKGVEFGQYLIHDKKGIIRVGDSLHILPGA